MGCMSSRKDDMPVLAPKIVLINGTPEVSVDPRIIHMAHSYDYMRRKNKLKLVDYQFPELLRDLCEHKEMEQYWINWFQRVRTLGISHRLTN